MKHTHKSKSAGAYCVYCTCCMRVTFTYAANITETLKCCAFIQYSIFKSAKYQSRKVSLTPHLYVSRSYIRSQTLGQHFILGFTDQLNQNPLFVSDESVLTQEQPSHYPIQLSFTQWLNFPPHSVSLTLASPNFLNRASLQTPGHFRSLPHSTNMFFGALPRILWHAPMPTPNLLSCLTLIQTTARGQWRWWGGGRYAHIVTVRSWCNQPSGKKKGWEGGEKRGEGEAYLMPSSVKHGINVWTWFILSGKAAESEPLPKNIHSWSLWWKLWLCLMTAVKLWTSDESLDEREMRERWTRVREEWEKWEEGERRMRDRRLGEVVVKSKTVREQWGYDIRHYGKARRLNTLLMNPQTMFSKQNVFGIRKDI